MGRREGSGPRVLVAPEGPKHDMRSAKRDTVSLVEKAHGRSHRLPGEAPTELLRCIECVSQTSGHPGK